MEVVELGPDLHDEHLDETEVVWLQHLLQFDQIVAHRSINRHLVHSPLLNRLVVNIPTVPVLLGLLHKHHVVYLQFPRVGHPRAVLLHHPPRQLQQLLQHLQSILLGAVFERVDEFGINKIVPLVFVVIGSGVQALLVGDLVAVLDLGMRVERGVTEVRLPALAYKIAAMLDILAPASALVLHRGGNFYLLRQQLPQLLRVHAKLIIIRVKVYNAPFKLSEHSSDVKADEGNEAR